jgi:repressor LexA
MHLTKRQKEIFDFIREHIDREGFAPSLQEIGGHFGLASVATVHKHVQNLVAKGLLRKSWNRSRSLQLVDSGRGEAVRVPLRGAVAAGVPVEAIPAEDEIHVPAEMVGRQPCYALRVRGESMIEDHIMDGDIVLVEDRKEPRDGETIVALVRQHEVTLKRYHRRGGMVRLVPANAALSPMEFPPEDVECQGVVIGLLRHY